MKDKIYKYYKDQLESESNVMLISIGSGFTHWVRDYIEDENKSIIFIVPNNMLVEQLQGMGLKAMLFQHINRAFNERLSTIRKNDIVIFNEMENMPNHWYRTLFKLQGRLSGWGVKTKTTYHNDNHLNNYLHGPIELKAKCTCKGFYQPIDCPQHGRHIDQLDKLR